MTNDEFTIDMRNASQSFKSNDKLTSFLYQLIRDHLPSGVVSELVREIADEPDDIVYTNGWLGEHADYLSKLLQKTNH